MRRFLAAMVVVGAMLPVALQAAEFTPAQRQEIITIMRDALKQDPSILRDAVASLQSDDDAKSAVEERGLIAGNKPALFAEAGDAMAGNPNGDVTLVEFYDPRCPYCRKMLPGIEAMVKQDSGLRLVYKDIPVLGPASVMEARAIVAAQMQGGYLKMQAALMANSTVPTAAMIAQTAKSIGLDPEKLAADMNGAAVTKRIQANLGLAHALKVQGTPAFVVGEQMIPGAVEIPQLQLAIADARKHAAR